MAEENDIIDEQDDDQSKHWYLWALYFNPKDKRLFPPKRTGLGWTINFANPYSVLLFVLLIGALVLLRVELHK